MYFVYLLLCQDGSLYTGITTDLKNRFLEHQKGKGGAYTRSHPPLKIIFQEPQPDKSSALKRELEIKSWSRQKKLDLSLNYLIKPSVVIFDFDGVIANTDPFNESVLKKIFLKYHLPFSSRVYLDFFSGKTLKDSVTAYLNYLQKPALIENVISEKKASDSVYGTYITAFPDALALIKIFRTKRLTLCLATGARRNQIDIALKKFALENTFKYIITGDDYAKGKPQPDVYNLIRAKFPPDTPIITIEDTPSGITSSHAAGLPCIAVTHTQTVSALSEADLIISTLTQLKNI